MKVKLAYGIQGLELDLPDDGVTVVEPKYLPGLPDPASSLRDALFNPLGTGRLKEIAGPGDRVAISICDSTRAMPSGRVLPVILQELGHLPPGNIKILIATGTHRPSTTEELERILGKMILREFEVINHVCTAEDSLVDLGTTSSGIPIILNRIWAESDIRITIGFVEPHFFAGFSGGPKMVAPGLAGLDTVLAIHSASLIADERSSWGIISDNPLHGAIREIVARTGVQFSLDVTLNRDQEITSVQAGEIFSVHEKARSFNRKTSMQEVEQPFDLVITTNSGYPLDLNLYQTVKGLSGAARVVKPGGTILCASECSDGIPGGTDFAEMVAEMESPREFLETISRPDFRRQDQWQAQVMAQVLAKAEVYLKSSGLSDSDILDCRMKPVRSMEEFIDGYLKRKPSARICVLPEGPQTIPYLKEGS